MKDQKNQSQTAYEQYPGRVWDNALQNIQEVYHKKSKIIRDVYSKRQVFVASSNTVPDPHLEVV